MFGVVQRCAFAAGILFYAITATGQAVRYVDTRATGSGDGTSWTDAFVDLQAALSAAQNDESISEIRVATGTYRPSALENPDDERSATFWLLNGLAVRGGYAGVGAADPDERDFVAYETVLSGDLNADDLPEFTNVDDNCYHVVTGSGAGPSAMLDGFTITGGNADGFELRYGLGGGMFTDVGAPTATDCVFRDNRSEFEGGAVCNAQSDASFLRCTFHGNSAESDGGAMYNTFSSCPLVQHCVFTGNDAVSGGAINNSGSDPLIVNSAFSGNSARAGGAIFNNASNPLIVNCTLSANGAMIEGGGIYNAQSAPEISNTIFWANFDAGGATESGQLFLDAGSIALVDHSCIQGLTGSLGGVGNLGVNPLIVDPDGPDDAFGTPDDDLRVHPGSPCIDAGDNGAVPETLTTDLYGEPRISQDPDSPDTGNPPDGAPFVDIGVHEFQAENVVRALAWRSVRTHGSLGPLAIEIDPAAGHNGTNPSTESRQYGIQAIEVDFDRPVVLVETVLAWDYIHDTAKEATSATLVNNDMTLVIGFAPGLLPDQACYQIDLAGVVAGQGFEPLGGDTNCRVRSLMGDVNSDGLVNLIDAANVKTFNGDPLQGEAIPQDLNTDGTINLIDFAEVKGRNGFRVDCN